MFFWPERWMILLPFSREVLIIGLVFMIVYLWYQRQMQHKKSAPVLKNGIKKGIAHFDAQFIKELGPLRIMEGQLGGLAHAEKELAMLVAPESGVVLKPVQSRGRGEREVAFYEYQRLNPTPIKSFLCGYYGISLVQRKLYLVLDDCCAGMSSPCTLDIKIGTKTYEDDAPKEKKLREAAKYPPQAFLGCRIVGMRLFDSSGQNISMYDKHWGYDVLNIKHLEHKLYLFFYNVKQPYTLILAFLQKLDDLIHVFEQNSQPGPFVFISSSLFFAYDAAFHLSSSSTQHLPRVTLRLIDFAHVRSENRTDSASLVGLHTVRTALANLLRQSTESFHPSDEQQNDKSSDHAQQIFSSTSLKPTPVR